jgi:hypothetical protein
MNKYKEYLNEIPYNTIKIWGETLMKGLPWQYVGWSGAAKEPYRHWAAYPELSKEVLSIWNTINFSLKEDGLQLQPERVIANLFAHGDSSWLHKDCDLDSAWTIIIYLNDYWDLNWGGETILVENNEILKAFAPTPGKFIAFKSNILHGPRPVSREAPYPRFGLTFQCANIQRIQQTTVPAICATQL